MTRTQAAVCLQKAWRRSREGLTYIKNEIGEIRMMTHTEYSQACKKLRPLLRRGRGNAARMRTIENTITVLREFREEYQCSHCVPVITSAKEPGKLPKWEMMSEKQIPDSFPSRGPFRLRPSAERECQTLQKDIPTTKKKLDELVKALQAEKDLLPCQYTRDGCYARAQLIIELLVMSGVPRNAIQKQYVCIPKKHEAFNWVYHVAPIVTLDDGSKYVIDPSLFDKAVSLGSWIKKQRTSQMVTLIPEDKGMLQAKAGQIRKLTYNPKEKITTFTSDCNTELVHIDPLEGRINLKTVTDSTCKYYLDKLAGFRLLLEKDFLKIGPYNEVVLPSHRKV